MKERKKKYGKIKSVGKGRKITTEREEKKKENNKNDDILSLCDLFVYIYLFMLFKICSWFI